MSNITKWGFSGHLESWYQSKYQGQDPLPWYRSEYQYKYQYNYKNQDLYRNLYTISDFEPDPDLDQKRCDRIKSLFAVNSFALLLLLVIAVGVCTGLGCINVKVGGGLIIGLSFVASCVEVVVLKIMWKKGRRNKEIFRDSMQEYKDGACCVGFCLVGTITGVVVGALLLSSSMSPMVGGIVAASVVSIPTLSGIALLCLYRSKLYRIKGY